MRIDRHRLRFVFWLDLLKPDEEAIADTIEHLKNERLFVKTIRDGIRLVCDLRGGGIDVLCELFPEVYERIKSEGQSEETRQILAALRHTNGASHAPPVVIEDTEEDIELEVKAVEDGSSAQNFLDSMKGLMG